MAKIEPANLLLKDKNGNTGLVKSLTNKDITTLKNVVTNVDYIKDFVNANGGSLPVQGDLKLTATDAAGKNGKTLLGTSSGTLQWNGKNIVRSVNGTNADANGNVSITSVANATKASQDKNGAQIDTTYFKSANGTFTGINYFRDVNNSLLRFNGGNTRAGGASLMLFGKNAESTQGDTRGHFDLVASTKEDGSDAKQLIGTPTGILKWDNKNIARSVNGVNADANGNITITRIDKHEDSSAGSANARYCEKDMTDYFNTGALSVDIANNNFSELSVGNFITKDVVVNGTTYSNVKFYLAHFDYYYNFGDGDTAITKHHVLILPATTLGTAAMNDTNTTEGGYLNSKMRKTTLPLYSAGYQAAFGSAHILGWRNLVTNDVDKTVGSSGYTADLGISKFWEWTDAVCELMSESMVYGAPVFSSSGLDTGSLHQQLALFRFNTSAILANRKWYWLRDVHSSTHFCDCDGDNGVNRRPASGVFDVRPFALLI